MILQPNFAFRITLLLILYIVFNFLFYTLPCLSISFPSKRNERSDKWRERLMERWTERWTERCIQIWVKKGKATLKYHLIHNACLNLTRIVVGCLRGGSSSHSASMGQHGANPYASRASTSVVMVKSSYFFNLKWSTRFAVVSFYLFEFFQYHFFLLSPFLTYCSYHCLNR